VEVSYAVGRGAERPIRRAELGDIPPAEHETDHYRQKLAMATTETAVARVGAAAP
jgi:hypothetical protein